MLRSSQRWWLLCVVRHQDFVHCILLLTCQKLKIKKRALFKSLPEKLRLYMKFQNILRLRKNLSENLFILEYFSLSDILSSKLQQRNIWLEFHKPFLNTIHTIEINTAVFKYDNQFYPCQKWNFPVLHLQLKYFLSLTFYFYFYTSEFYGKNI